MSLIRSFGKTFLNKSKLQIALWGRVSDGKKCLSLILSVSLNRFHNLKTVSNLAEFSWVGYAVQREKKKHTINKDKKLN